MFGWLYPTSGFNAERDAYVGTPECGYWTFKNIMEVDLWSELAPNYPLRCDYQDPVADEETKFFEGMKWTRFNQTHWHIPILAVVIYLSMLFYLKRTMATRAPIRLTPLVICWNLMLSAFSFAGLFYTVPKLLNGPAGLLNHGWYASVCNHASNYGHGMSGLFVALFIYSKLAELLDTLWLLLRKSPVIFLHWYHHVTVLLYCWHAYAVRIGTGLWFASMNYTVHALMYLYFAVTQLGPRGKAFAKRFSIFITTLQLLQMVMGIAVTVASVIYHAREQPCYVSLVNSALGLLMYASYFALFLQLFLSHYVYKKRGASTKLGHSAGCPPIEAVQGAAEAAAKAKPAQKVKAI